MKVLVFGRSGQLGSALEKIAPTGYKTVFLTRSDIDFSDLSRLRAAVLSHKPAVVVNAAAYTAVDRAESEKSIAFKVNGEAPGVIATACSQIGAVLVHFSTDYVFDGTASSPYVEGALTNPLGIYGQSKLAGEEAIAAVTGRYVILRTAWVYSLVGQNFLKTMLRLANNDDEIRVVSDQIGSPTYAGDLAQVAWSIIDSLLENNASKFGIYHATNSGVTSWYRFASEIFDLVGLTGVVVHPISTDQYPTLAPRPRFTALSCVRINEVFGITMPNWQDAVSRCLKDL
jgi:dTDP-4-dehydrorhamnose reductase